MSLPFMSPWLKQKSCAVSRLQQKPTVLTDTGTTGTMSTNRTAGLTCRRPLLDFDVSTHIIPLEKAKYFP
jgi:hypothetical protein